MISCLEELSAAKKILNECRDELSNEKIKFSNDFKVGIMIAIPSAALMSDTLAKHVDFFSMGTNDLTQYTCAVDRINQKISHLYNPFNPGLLRLIKLTAESAKAGSIDISICGSMAHFPELIPFFIGCGIKKLSMSPMHILKTKANILKFSKDLCEQMVPKLLKLETTEEIKKYLTSFHEEMK
jgi:phosphotransferase system enzyme I (PtsI)